MQGLIPFLIYTFVVFLLPGLVLASGFVQISSVERQKKILTDIEDDNPLSKTYSFKTALAYFESIPAERFIAFTQGFKTPIGILFVLILMFAYIMSIVEYPNTFLNNPNYFLGGIFILSQNNTPEAIGHYQAGTLITITLAFVGAYIVILTRLFRRINNYDIDPMSYYFLSLHIIMAVLVAAVLRHTFYWGNEEIDHLGLIALGFSVGLKPDLFMKFIVEKGIAFTGKTKGQKEIDPEKLPSIMPLSMIEGLTEETRLRLRELDIDNSQNLSQQNPIILWVRTSYQLLHIIDWIAQAQLYILVENEGMHKLRLYAIRDIFSFVKVAKGSAESGVANLLNMKQVDLGNLVQSIEETPAFKYLQEINQRLGENDHNK